MLLFSLFHHAYNPTNGVSFWFASDCSYAATGSFLSVIPAHFSSIYLWSEAAANLRVCLSLSLWSCSLISWINWHHSNPPLVYLLWLFHDSCDPIVPDKILLKYDNTPNSVSKTFLLCRAGCCSTFTPPVSRREPNGTMTQALLTSRYPADWHRREINQQREQVATREAILAFTFSQNTQGGIQFFCFFLREYIVLFMVMNKTRQTVSHLKLHRSSDRLSFILVT